VRAINIALLFSCACGRLGFDGEPPTQSSPPPPPEQVTQPNGATKGPGASLDLGMVAHLSLDGSLMDSISGTDAECSGGECPSFVAGINGEAASFDGTATCVHMPWLTSWMPAQYTISAWIQPTSESGPIVVREHDTSCPSPSLESSDKAVGFIGTDMAGGHQEGWSGTVLSMATWTHVAIEFDGTNQSVYVDGACACAVEPSVPLNYATYEVTVGCYPAASTWYAGAIDDVRIYDRSLSPAELALLAGASNTTDCSSVCNTTQP
jgi:Concanavalin A-like lectin/glucanases superfamily